MNVLSPNLVDLSNVFGCARGSVVGANGGACSAAAAAVSGRGACMCCPLCVYDDGWCFHNNN